MVLEIKLDYQNRIYILYSRATAICEKPRFEDIAVKLIDQIAYQRSLGPQDCELTITPNAEKHLGSRNRRTLEDAVKLMNKINKVRSSLNGK